MSAIFSTSDGNINENIKEPIGAKSPATGSHFQGRGVRNVEREKEETRANVVRDGRKQALAFLFFFFFSLLSVKLGVTLGVWKEVWLRLVVFT